MLTYMCSPCLVPCCVILHCITWPLSPTVFPCYATLLAMPLAYHFGAHHEGVFQDWSPAFTRWTHLISSLPSPEPKSCMQYHAQFCKSTSSKHWPLVHQYNSEEIWANSATLEEEELGTPPASNLYSLTDITCESCPNLPPTQLTPDNLLSPPPTPEILLIPSILSLSLTTSTYPTIFLRFICLTTTMSQPTYSTPDVHLWRPWSYAVQPHQLHWFFKNFKF